MAALATPTAVTTMMPNLFGRAACPADTFQCPTSLGAAFSDICCQNGQTCAYDSNQNPACCPSGAVCTGIAPSTPGAPATATPGPQTVSYVPNQYFSFPYAATTFDNSGACSSAVSACSRNYDVCLTDLQGGAQGYGVTIVVPSGGGVTVPGTGTDLGAPSATSVCSSLSSEACGELSATGCSSFEASSGAALVAPPVKSLLTLVVGAAMVFSLVGTVP